MRAPASAALALALALAGAPAAAQVVAVSPAPRGWIGISFDMTTTRDAAGVRTSVTVTEVREGSPAARAGIRAGDVLLSINGRDWRDGSALGQLTLRPGDPVRLAIERDGVRRDVRMTAAPRPDEPVVLPSWTVTLGVDSVVEGMYRAMDSLRLRLLREGPGGFALAGSRLLSDSGVAVLQGVHGEPLRVRALTTGRVAVTPFGEPVEGLLVPEVRPPFEFYIFRGEAHDSLREAMERLNQEIRELRSRQVARTRELARRLGENEARFDRADPELRRVEEALRDADRRATELRGAMERAARVSAAEHVRVVPALPQEAPEAAVAEARFRPLTPYVLGQNRAAGAEVVDLRPELAAYFAVDGGVLVIDVPEGTPAAGAGIQPGDVLVRVGDDPVRDIRDLRVGLARPADGIALTLVRRGERIRVLLRR